MSDVAAEIERWWAWARGTSEQIVSTAVSSDKAGGGAWDQLLRDAGVERLEAAARAELTDKGPPRTSGPPPIEVRRALEAVARSVAQGCLQLEAMAERSAEDHDDAITRLRLGAERLIDEKLRAYIAAVRPRISTSSIFANAAATRARHVATGVGPNVTTTVCDCCGAPRTDAMKVGPCRYCGSGSLR